jgi:distribution and morphology protein 12
LSVLQNIIIESAIGDQNVLNNVGKIEKFIVNQLKAFINEYAVYPNYHMIYLHAEEHEGASTNLGIYK